MPDLPPWLTRQYDFGASLARGVSSGSEIHHNFLADQQSAREDALMPLRMQQMQMQTQSAALDLQMKQDATMDQLAAKKEEAGLLELGSGISEWWHPGVEMGIRQYGAENPQATKSPIYKELLDRAHISQKEKANADWLGARAAWYDARPGIDLAKADIAAEAKQYDADSRSRTEAAKETGRNTRALDKNATAIETANIRSSGSAAKMKNDLKSRLPDITYRAASEEFKGIESDMLLKPDEKAARLKQAYDKWTSMASDAEDALRAKLDERVKGMNTPNGAGAEPRVPMIGPDGRRGTVPKSQIEDALRNGYKLPQ